MMTCFFLKRIMMSFFGPLRTDSRSEKKSFLRPEHGMTPSRSTLCVRELQV